MAEYDVQRIEPGMEVYDSTGHEIGAVTRVLRKLYWPLSVVDPGRALVSEDIVEVKTTSFLGLPGRSLHLHLRDLVSVTEGALFLSKSLTELKTTE